MIFLVQNITAILICGSTRNALWNKNPGLFERYSCQRIHKHSELGDELVLDLPLKDRIV